ncbi:MAG: hypothetical protein WEB67_10625 [Acidimicrobiia bacterium]
MSATRWAALVGLLTVVSACVAGTTVATPAQSDLVSFAIRLGPDDADFLNLAEEQLISRCMAERGFQYEVISAPIDPADLERRYRLPNGDVAAAEANGYGLRDAFEKTSSNDFSDQPGPTDANGRHVASLTPEQQKEWMEALHGTGKEVLVTEASDGIEQYIFTDGCVANMEATLYGDLEEFFRITGVIGLAGREVYERMVADPEWVETQEHWQSCMSGRGYAVFDLEDPIDQANDVYLSGIPVAEAHAHDIEIAIDDSKCAAEVGLGAKYRALVQRYETEYATSHEADLIVLQELQQRAVVRAKELLNDE